MNTDLYKEKAAAIFNVKYADVTEAQRLYAKMTCYVPQYMVSHPLSEIVKGD